MLHTQARVYQAAFTKVCLSLLFYSSYTLHTCDDKQLSGQQALCHGLPLAYGGKPWEHVPFIGCHDNQTMFDQIVEKANREVGHHASAPGARLADLRPLPGLCNWQASTSLYICSSLFMTWASTSNEACRSSAINSAAPTL